MSILVVGDVMLDIYVEGVVRRISPEAPVPVLQIANEVSMLGGAANVARNIVALGTGCSLHSVVGRDPAAKEISNKCASGCIDFDFIHDEHRWTTVKKRYEAQGQQILRVDDECSDDLSEYSRRKLVERVTKCLRETKILVLSDYAKGVLTNDVCRSLIAAAQERGVTVIVDPKQKNLSRYSGAHIIKPNADELSKATGLPTETKEQCVTAAYLVSNTFRIPHVLVTRGQHGMVLCSPGHRHEENGRALEVANVVGAGDTALAALAVGLNEGLDMKNALALANAAAAIAVSKHGTATVTRQEVKDAFVGA